MKIFNKLKQFRVLLAFLGAFISASYFCRLPVVNSRLSVANAEKFSTVMTVGSKEKQKENYFTKTWLEDSRIYGTGVDIEPTGIGLGYVSKFTGDPTPSATSEFPGKGPEKNSQEISTEEKKNKSKSKVKKKELITNISIALFILYVLYLIDD